MVADIPRMPVRDRLTVAALAPTSDGDAVTALRVRTVRQAIPTHDGWANPADKLPYPLNGTTISADNMVQPWLKVGPKLSG